MALPLNDGFELIDPEWLAEVGLGRLRARTLGLSSLARLVDDLLDMRHLTGQGGKPLDLRDADLTELTRETVERVREHVERTGASLTLNAPTAVGGRWDPIRIEQVVTNLVNNAARFGEGKPIVVNVEGDGDRARIDVSDQGIGIAAPDLERIFERFERVSPIAGGLGLGLGARSRDRATAVSHPRAAHVHPRGGGAWRARAPGLHPWRRAVPGDRDFRRVQARRVAPPPHRPPGEPDAGPRRDGPLRSVSGA